jgi:hypothetical protein
MERNTGSTYMSITINIQIETGDVAPGTLEQHMRTLGFTREYALPSSPSIGATLEKALAYARQAPMVTSPPQVDAETDAALGADTTACAMPSVLNEPVVAAKVAEAKRERGKPGPGRKRRTAEEVAEDEAADRADAAQAKAPESTSAVSDLSVATSVEPAAETAPAIRSDPENRVDPDDSLEDQAQDAADEAAETSAPAGEPTKLLTRDDLRAAMGAYAKRFGMPVTIEDGPKIMVSALGEPPAGETMWKVTLVPEDKIGKAVVAWEAAAGSNPFGRATNE